MNRRKFIFLSTLGATALTLSFGYFYSRKDRSNNDLTEPYALLEILDAPTISGIGKTYLQIAPEEKNHNVLIRLLRGSASPDRLVSEFIPVAIRSDFAANRIIILNGWVLSQTEARQCALYALDHNT